jgi:hypothetical protein
MSRGRFVKYHLVDNSPVPDNGLAVLVILMFIIFIQPMFYIADGFHWLHEKIS